MSLSHSLPNLLPLFWRHLLMPGEESILFTAKFHGKIRAGTYIVTLVQATPCMKVGSFKAFVRLVLLCKHRGKISCLSYIYIL